MPAVLRFSCPYCWNDDMQKDTLNGSLTKGLRSVNCYFWVEFWFLFTQMHLFNVARPECDRSCSGFSLTLSLSLPFGLYAFECVLSKARTLKVSRINWKDSYIAILFVFPYTLNAFVCIELFSNCMLFIIRISALHVSQLHTTFCFTCMPSRRSQPMNNRRIVNGNFSLRVHQIAKYRFWGILPMAWVSCYSNWISYTVKWIWMRTQKTANGFNSFHHYCLSNTFEECDGSTIQLYQRY